MKKYIKCNVLCIERALLIAFVFIFSTFNFVLAQGYIYWTPNGVLLNTTSSAVTNPVDNMKGGAIVIASGLVDVFECLRAIHVDSNGNLPWGLDGIIVDTTTLGYFWGVSDGRRGAIVVWTFLGGVIYYQRIDSTGNEMWGADPCVTLSDSIQGSPAIISDDANGVIITWQEGWNWQYDIYAQRIDSNGVRQWGDYGVAVCTTGSDQMVPAITCDSAGNSVLVWQDSRNGELDLFAQRLNINGLPLWQSNGIAVCDAESAQYITNFGSIIMATDTTVFFCWSDLRNGNQDIYSHCLDINGLPLWIAQGIPVCDTVNTQSRGQLIADGKGGAVFCWVDERIGFKNIYAQRLDSLGQKLWNNQGIPICTADSCAYQRIVFDGRTGAFICWQDKRSGNWDVYAQHIDSLGNVLWDTNGMAVCAVGNTQRSPEITASDSSTAIICWDDRRSGSWRGYAQKIGDEPQGIKEKTQDTRYVLDVYPNPFQQTLSIKYSVGHSEKCLKLKIYSVSGRLVKTLVNEVKAPGVYVVYWDGNNRTGIKVSSGIYFCILETEKDNFVKKILFMK